MSDRGDNAPSAPANKDSVTKPDEAPASDIDLEPCKKYNRYECKLSILRLAGSDGVMKSIVSVILAVHLPCTHHTFRVLLLVVSKRSAASSLF